MFYSSYRKLRGTKGVASELAICSQQAMKSSAAAAGASNSKLPRAKREDMREQARSTRLDSYRSHGRIDHAHRPCSAASANAMEAFCPAALSNNAHKSAHLLQFEIKDGRVLLETREP